MISSASHSPREAGLAERTARDEFEYSMATAPVTRWHRRLAFAVIVVLLAIYGAVVPFATMPLLRIDSFIPMVMAIVFVTDLVTAVLLLVNSRQLGHAHSWCLQAAICFPV